MRKMMVFMSAMLLSFGLLVGCANDTNNNATNNTVNNTTNNEVENNSEVEEITVEVILSEDKGEETLEKKEVTTEDGAILLDVMKENFDVEEDGGFITSIDGKQAEEGEEKGWIYYVNDEMAMVGAAEFELSEGDVVNFDFQPWE